MLQEEEAETTAFAPLFSGRLRLPTGSPSAPRPCPVKGPRPRRTSWLRGASPARTARTGPVPRTRPTRPPPARPTGDAGPVADTAVLPPPLAQCLVARQPPVTPTQGPGLVPPPPPPPVPTPTGGVDGPPLGPGTCVTDDTVHTGDGVVPLAPPRPVGVLARPRVLVPRPSAPVLKVTRCGLFEGLSLLRPRNGAVPRPSLLGVSRPRLGAAGTVPVRGLAARSTTHDGGTRDPYQSGRPRNVREESQP